jgi:hypothetical protein
LSNEDPEAGARVAKYTGGNIGNEVGSYQGDSNQAHTHTGVTNVDGAHRHTNQSTWLVDNDDNDNTSCTVGYKCGQDPSGASPQPPHSISEVGSAHQHGFTTNIQGSADSRPRNAYVNYLIKY